MTELNAYRSVLLPPVLNPVPCRALPDTVLAVLAVCERLLTFTACAWAGAGGNRTTPASKEKTPKAQRLRRTRLGAVGNRPQQPTRESRTSAEPMRLPLRRAGGGASDQPEHFRP